MAKEISTEIKAFADELEADAKFNADTKQVETPNFDTIAAKHMPASLTAELVKEAHDFTVIAGAAQTLAAGNVLKREMISDKDLDKGTMKNTLGHAALETSYERSKSGSVAGKDWKRYGVTRTDVTLGVGRKKAPLTAVYEQLSSEAESVFSN